LRAAAVSNVTPLDRDDKRRPWFLDPEDKKAYDLGVALSEPIASVEAEQALLGALLYDNSAFHRLPPSFTAEAFYEPFHRRLFESVAWSISQGLLAEPVILMTEFRRDPAFLELGGLRYLSDLVDRAPAAVNAPDYARAIHGLWLERETVNTAVELALEVVKTKKGQRPGADVLAEAEAALMRLRMRDRTSDPVTMADAVAGTVAYVQDTTKPAGVKTGLAPIDRHLGFILPGDFVVIGGATGMGKSAVGLAISQNVASPELAARMNGVDPDPLQRPKGVFTLHGEMTWGGLDLSGQAVRRHIADVGFWLYGPKFPTYQQIRNKQIELVQLEMMKEAGLYLAAVPMVGVARSRMTVPQLQAAVERQCVAWEREGVEPGLTVVDHLGLMAAVKPSGSVYQDQSEIANGLKDMGVYLGRKWGMAVIALAQLSRAVSKQPNEDKRPQLHDLKNSGDIENAADLVALLYRDAYYAQREPDVPESKQVEWAKQDARRRCMEIEVILGKLREGAANHVAKVWADMRFNAIRGHEPAGIPGGLL
jgi:replicative DNA helicase